MEVEKPKKLSEYTKFEKTCFDCGAIMDIDAEVGKYTCFDCEFKDW